MLTALVLAAVLAQTPAGTHAYRVEIRPRFQAIGYTGELKLTFTGNGYVNGTYRADTGGTIKPVRGGYKGDRIWLDVPALGGLHVEAAMKDSGISGVAAPAGMSNRQYIFTATPEALPSS